MLSIVGFNPHFYRYPPELEPVERDISYLGGIALTLIENDVELSFRHFTDLTGVHDGTETELSLFKTWKIGRWSVSFEALATLKSKELINYYYQLREEESRSLIFDYDPNQPAVNVSVMTSIRRPIAEDWSVLLSYKKTFLDKAITNSPIIDNNNVALYFMGIEYYL